MFAQGRNHEVWRLKYFFYPLISITGFSSARGSKSGINVRNRLQLYGNVLRVGSKPSMHLTHPFLHCTLGLEAPIIQFRIQTNKFNLGCFGNNSAVN